jgi:S-adenosylmethionine hydrolase
MSGTSIVVQFARSNEKGYGVQSIICFVSDFGLDDTWVGVCHAVIHRACPQARVVDLGHYVPPFDIRKGAATAAAGAYQIPDAIHLVVVDPGVGAGRRDLCLVTKRGTRLVGPDNGVLIPAAQRVGGISEAFVIDPGKIDFGIPLATFHARDILAPVAAALACGVEPRSLGDLVSASSLAPAPFEMCRVENDHVVGEVLEEDRFGSLRLNIPSDDLDQLGLRASELEVSLGHNSLVIPVRKTFAEVAEGSPVVLVDSSGWLTVAVNRGSAADRYGVTSGAEVVVRRAL